MSGLDIPLLNFFETARVITPTSEVHRTGNINNQCCQISATFPHVCYNNLHFS